MLGNTAARLLVAPDYPIGAQPDQLEALVAMIEAGWGTEALAAVGAPRN